MYIYVQLSIYITLLETFNSSMKQMTGKKIQTGATASFQIREFTLHFVA